MYTLLSPHVALPVTRATTARNVCGATVPFSLRAVVLVVAAMGAIPAVGAKEVPKPDGRNHASDRAADDGRTITMTEEEFDEFMQKRRQYQEALPFLGVETFIPDIKHEVRRARSTPFVHVQLPDRRMPFCQRSVSIRLYRDDVRQLVDALPYFPETRDVWVRVQPDLLPSQRQERTPYTATVIPHWMLEGLRELPHMDWLGFQGGNFDAEAMAIIGSYPNLRRLNLGHCRVTPESFAELASANSLEAFAVQSGLGPDCFITLAKLPRFKEFTLLSGFNVPIDDETRHAIESLDGRLTRFHASEIGTVVHLSFVRALLQVKSIEFLDIDTIRPGATLSDVEQLQRLPNLQSVSIGWSFAALSPDDRAEATRVLNQVAKETHARRMERRRQHEQSPR